MISSISSRKHPERRWPADVLAGAIIESVDDIRSGVRERQERAAALLGLYRS